MDLKGWMTVKQAADEKKVTPEAVRQAVKAGRLHGDTVGHVTLVWRASLAEWKPMKGGFRGKRKG